MQNGFRFGLAFTLGQVCAQLILILAAFVLTLGVLALTQHQRPDEPEEPPPSKEWNTSNYRVLH